MENTKIEKIVIKTSIKNGHNFYIEACGSRYKTNCEEEKQKLDKRSKGKHKILEQKEQIKHTANENENMVFLPRRLSHPFIIYKSNQTLKR